MPYILVGGTKFYERAEIKDALAYLRLANNPSDDVSFRRVVNVPARGVGTATLEAVEAAASERGVSLLAVLDAPREGLTERAKKALAEFRDLVAKLRDFGAAEGCGAGAAVAFALEETGLLKLYESSLDRQDGARRENLDELLAAAREHERATSFGGEGDDPSVAGFLDAVTLRADADEADEKKGILLITLHAAKGLEFDEVFLAGFEEGSLPHASSRDDDEQFEEERRLAYVGMTRAKDRLTLSYVLRRMGRGGGAGRASPGLAYVGRTRAKDRLTLSYVLRRMVRGEWMSREPSPFLSAIPESVLERGDLTSGFGRGRTGDFLESGERGGARERGFGPGRGFGRGGSLFPDYENESQEPSASPSSSSRFPARNLSPIRPVMKRTPPPPTASGFRRGSKVRHPEYGPGVVLTIEGSGDAEKLTVYFDRAGRKKFVARYANLSPG